MMNINHYASFLDHLTLRHHDQPILSYEAPKIVSLDRIVEEVAIIMQCHALLARVIFDVEQMPKTWIKADKFRLKRIFLKHLSNVLQKTPPEGIIQISLIQHPPVGVIMISNSTNMEFVVIRLMPNRLKVLS